MASDAFLAKYPPEFLTKMALLLGDEYSAFIASLDRPRSIGLRVNPLKISAVDFSRISPFSLTPLGEFEPAAFILPEPAKAGSHPYHAAGLYYLQEPAAMVAGSLLDPRPGELVLDLAAAPGGKATHMAARMDNKGLLVANDVQRNRAQLLAQNMERLGVTNALICDETPDHLAATFGPIFDRVLLDAPCSGESLFRRLDEVEWSPAIVEACARRQTGILDVAADLVRPGGIMAYATCAFSPEENEQQLDIFLSTHQDFSMAPISTYAGFDRGRPDWIAAPQLSADVQLDIAYGVHLWPHHFPGEGHFIALMQREERAEEERPLELIQPDRQRNAISLWNEFQQQTLTVKLAEERIHFAHNRLYLLPDLAIKSGSLHLLRYGLLLGEARRGYFKPAHTLAMALTGSQVQQQVDWTADDPEISAYLSGHDMASSGANGWVMVSVDGYPLGWGKRSSGRLKNHYPRGLRRPA
ncbi:MAG: RsmF rRNA methyltransferase first C-terminal domain-containing protein [Candidatus Promineifilaceae bacterium]|jgi:16S rRNA C967 or C1407 C5-methylase (RsmB/RsmF family)/NOL1/NOP2/fmu family ribosome biogenesis protein